MNIRFYIDQETGLPHIYNHDVDEVEVERVVKIHALPLVKPKPDVTYGSSMFQSPNLTASL